MKPIPNYEGYFATEDGHIFSTRRNRFLAETVNRDGYKRVTIKNNCRSVHRLVAMAYIPNPNDYPCINHKDEDKLNNSVENLEWCTYQYNNSYGKGQPTKKAIEAKSKPVVQLSLDGRYIGRYKSAAEAERRCGAKCPVGSNVATVCRGKRKDAKTAYGYKWMFEKDYEKLIK